MLLRRLCAIQERTNLSHPLRAQLHSCFIASSRYLHTHTHTHTAMSAPAPTSASAPSSSSSASAPKPAAAAAVKGASEGGAESKTKEKKEKKKGQDKFADASKPKFVNQTPRGQLKDFSSPMAEAYQPVAVESAWDSWWQAQGLYAPEEKSDKEKFVIMIPPPNVTGTLHVGHALTLAIQDAVVRWNRMSGKNTLWVPGTDHAGIATQVVVERQLQREKGLSRHDIGREAFLKEVWKWKETSGNRIYSQIERLGASVDWSRAVFTMDEVRSAAVEEAFFRLHDKKLINRANRLVNWSCSLRSAISNIEVDHEELTGPKMLKVPGYDEPVEFGVMHSFAYKFTDGSGEIVVATTRIETMLGDTAVAVHPNDPRHTAAHGKTLIHPFIADRIVKIVCDEELVDMAVGTGAVKITPAHDPNDFKCGLRHKLPMLNILTPDGLINENGGRFAGKKRFDVRKELIVELTKLGLYKGKEPKPMNLGICSRSKDVVEQVLRPQWYVDTTGMAKKAVDAVKNKELKILPVTEEQTWYSWLNEPQDWCISRQLWWGHRIPAYHVRFAGEENVVQGNIDDNAHWFTGRSEQDAKQKAESQTGKKVIAVQRDEDVLDTWFSSGLFPFSTMGWPKQTQDLEDFYPGTLLETGKDILFFWVARMVMMGLELTDKLPFKTVYLHAMVRDKSGEKMSKSSGNVIDPLDVMDGTSLQQLQDGLIKANVVQGKKLDDALAEQKRQFPEGISECGSDALRFGLLAYTAESKNMSISLNIDRVVAYRQFGNKLWQATRFALLNFDDKFAPPASLDSLSQLMKASPSLADRWIMHRLHTAIVTCDNSFKAYEFGAVTTAVYNFWLYDLCDVYLELIKPTVRLSECQTPADHAQRGTALAVLYTCLDFGLRLLHPLMPFITEELYHRLPGANIVGNGGRATCGSIMITAYPSPTMSQPFSNARLDSTMKLLQDISHSARSSRASLNLTKQKLTMYIRCTTEEDYNTVKENAKDITVMAFAQATHALTANDAPPAGCMSSILSATIEIFIPLQGLVDVGSEIVKMEKAQFALNARLQKLKDQMKSDSYGRVPQAQKTKNDEQLANDTIEATKIQTSIDNFKSVLSPEQLKKYGEDKRASLQLEKEKLQKSIEKMKAALPADPKDHPKKSLMKISEAEQEIADIDSQLAK